MLAAYCTELAVESVLQQFKHRYMNGTQHLSLSECLFAVDWGFYGLQCERNARSKLLFSVITEEY